MATNASARARGIGGAAFSAQVLHRLGRLAHRRRASSPGRVPRLFPELLLLVAVDAVYKYGRKLANGQTSEAFAHARAVWSLERRLHVPSEHAVQQVMLHSESVTRIANYLYATVHFPAMLLFLGYMFLRHRAHYLWIRRALVVQTMAALVIHCAYPLAPPRMLSGTGMVDTAQVYGPSVYGATPDGHSMANQFAAMPSLHVGWALAIAVGLIAAHRPAPGAAGTVRSRLRYLWLLHPVLTCLIVVGTANHYWLDGIVGSALLGLALALVPGPLPAAEPAAAASPVGRTRTPLGTRPPRPGGAQLR
ncbi:PAP2 superfamily protein [Actinacidiphila alni]|uniref:PAP2 superfamily protein n=1 Tax=Actinacidiphila alni TaxID=380248 RepID=A0A1I2H232_9ACTN|nr:phosphatase PAP2 family protein [Actinacidiphila alni]SFF23752.1 PAP2 superfamily protein [Actinacidiphila alni]